MRAVWLRAFGPPEVLAAEHTPDPEAGPGQVVVNVAAAGIVFIDTQIRAGRLSRQGYSRRLPLIPGNSVGGVVTAVGPGVDSSLVGQRVVTTTGHSGGYAEQVAVDARAIIPVPPGLELTDALALLSDGRTAMALIRASRLGPGEQVLVEAAGGGVGSLLVQLAASAGARVIAAAGDQRKLDLARDLGSAVGVDYTEPDWNDRVRVLTDGAGVDVAFDSVGGAIGRAAFELMAVGGRFLVFGQASGSVTAASLVEVFQRGLIVIGRTQVRSATDNRQLVAHALSEAVEGRLRPIIGQTFPLERAADAHAAIEARATVGKTLLIC
jgi:NADPH2:quinone reductase